MQGGEHIGGTNKKELRRGWTTGACAAAAAKAATQALFAGAFPDPVTIRLPGGQEPAFTLAQSGLTATGARAAIVKDAGDDPDVTHGALIEVAVEPAPAGAGLVFRAGPGVGTVTRPGLPLAVGEPAINPAPRAMIRDNLLPLAKTASRPLDLIVTIGVGKGEQLATRTWNGRLGIVGGLSILGTSGIVVPYSCAAWIHAIQSGVDVARAAGLDHLIGATGKRSEAAARTHFSAPEQALIDMGDFVGGFVKYVRRHPVARVTIAGGFAKMSKLACGATDLHSKRAQVDMAYLGHCAARTGAPTAVATQIGAATSAGEALNVAMQGGIDLARPVAVDAQRRVAEMAGSGIAASVLIVDRGGTIIGEA